MALIPELTQMKRVQGAAEMLFSFTPAHVLSLVGSMYGAYFKTRYYAGSCHDRMRDLIHLEKSSRREVDDYENKKLRMIVKHCYDSVPYYRKHFKRIGVSVNDIRNREDLHKLPILTREGVARNHNELLSICANPRRSMWVGTSGTTGTPLKVLWDREVQDVEFAYVHAHWRWAGFSIRQRRATLRGNVVIPTSREKPPHWILNMAERQLLMSAFHLKPDTIESYVEKLSRFRPIALQGYPSSLYIAATLMQEAGLSVEVPIAFTASEPLHDHYKERIEEVFGCRTYDMYGQTERVGMAVQCEKGSYHIPPGYGVLEIVDEEGYPTEGKTGKLLGTGLNNWLMPLIRYDTGDICLCSDDECECGREYPTIGKIMTKSEDIIVTPDGTSVSPSVLTHPFKNVKGVIRSQIVQEKPELVIVKLMTNEAFSPSDGKLIVSELGKRLGEDVSIELQIVDEIPYSGRGKFKWIVSKVGMKCSRLD